MPKSKVIISIDEKELESAILSAVSSPLAKLEREINQLFSTDPEIDGLEQKIAAIVVKNKMKPNPSDIRAMVEDYKEFRAGEM